MLFINGKISMQKVALFIMNIALALVIIACGGGGGSGGTPITGTGSGGSGGSTTTSPTISIKLLNSSGSAASLVSTSSPLTAQATVLSASGVPVPNVLVNFSTGQQYTTVSPVSGAVLTNSSGVATITLSLASLTIAQTDGGAGDVLTANANLGTVTATGSANFSVGSTAVTLSLVAPNPSTLPLTAYASTLIKVNVLANGQPYTANPVVVNFSSACATSGKATLPATATTVNGQAQITYTDNGCSATDPITISVAGSSAITATLIVAAPTAESIEFVSAVPSNETIVIQGAGGNGRLQTATLTFKALDTSGNPLPNEQINFSLSATKSVTLGLNSAVTDANGEAVVTVNSGTQPTTFRVIATLPTGQSTISDTVAVTTGQPIQLAFSASASTYNIEGWDFDGTQTTLSILMADNSGNPVADGTPVVFETDSGAVGSSTDGGCLTTNGGCSVTFRSQEPRYGAGHNAPAGKRAGLATVSISSTSSSGTLSGQLGIYLSGSGEEDVDSLNIIQSPSNISLTSCASTQFTLQLNDVNNNPMPAGTTITATPLNSNSAPTAVMSNVFPIYPASVPNLAPVLNSSQVYQGSIHTFTFTPGGGTGSATACNPNGTVANTTGNIEVVLTTPKGVVNTFLVPFKYPQ